MSFVVKYPVIYSQVKVLSRGLSSSPVLNMKEWRAERGLPANRNAEGVLTDAPDFTYLDGRPSPLLHKQKYRIEKQRSFATKIVRLCSELDFAKERYQQALEAEEKERQDILSNRLKPKGNSLVQKK